MKCNLTVHDEVWCHFSGLSPVHIEFLWKEFGKHPEGYFFMKKYQLRQWDGYVRFFTKEGRTYVRLLPEIIPFIEAWGYEIALTDKRTYYEAPTLSCKVTGVDTQGIANKAEGQDIFGDVYFKGKKLELRPYQIQGLIAAVEAGSGFLIHATGAGKSLTTAALSKVYCDAGYRTITIVPSDDLVGQTLAWYQRAGLDVGVYSGSIKDIHHDCVVATWQALQYNPNVMKNFLCVIYDECVHPLTLVDTIDGQKYIKDIKIGDLVKTKNENNSNIEYKSVVKVHHNLSKNQKVFKITSDAGEDLIVTGNHKIKTKSGWKRVDKLTLADELM